ncbi:Ferritin-1, chloroplastic [Triticum urartu]|uniref:Ferritin n=1 Tax=Triticum urartu TaxID=4572 RepID=M7ZH27_TRIUA|nr:Ferritin-1, chloroplastic [Triticum urartu]
MTAAGKGKKEEVLLSGVMFQPFEELKGELSLVPQAEGQSLARQKFVDECEAAINEQINVEYNASYAYHSLYAYFDRDNVALKGFAKFFKESSDEEREHAEMLMEYQMMLAKSSTMIRRSMDHRRRSAYAGTFGVTYTSIGVLHVLRRIRRAVQCWRPVLRQCFHVSGA